jgi:hypothetical protein
MTEKQESHSNYKGFVAGVFSGIAKLSGMSKPHSSRTVLEILAGELLGRYIELD